MAYRIQGNPSGNALSLRTNSCGFDTVISRNSGSPVVAPFLVSIATRPVIHRTQHLGIKDKQRVYSPTCQILTSTSILPNWLDETTYNFLSQKLYHSWECDCLVFCSSGPVTPPFDNPSAQSKWVPWVISAQNIKILTIFLPKYLETDLNFFNV
jgi:hypothetical protein